MSTPLKLLAPAAAGSRAVRISQRRMFNATPVAISWAVLTGIFVFLRLYLQAFAFKYGLDSTAPVFETYWKTLFKIEVPLIFGIGLAIWSYLWLTRDRNLDALKPEVELRRYFNLVGWFLVYIFAFLGIACIFGEGDATWHQTVVRDTALTPSHIVVFYACVPMYMVAGISSLIYATTRLPVYARSYSIPLLMVVIGPGMILPNLGFNEWGHAFWFTEEIFSHPLHWGFPVLGWTGLALGGVLVQVMARMAQLFKQLSPAGAAASG
jgi:methane/ammonia monooxygenase subunit C